MSDVKTTFKLETSQYDSKLRDASNALAKFAEKAAVAGNEFDKFTKHMSETAKGLGSIEGGANNAKDKVRELVNAFNTLANAYNNLTKEQKKSDFGKAMADSLTQLQGRLKEAKDNLYGMGQQTDKTGGLLGKLKDRFMLTVDATKLFNVGLKAAKAALDVAKDAFFASESTLDEWGRIVQSSTSLYEGFLNALNTGDIGGYISRIDDIITAARAAYNELDRLGTMKTILGPSISKQETENNRLRMMIQTGRYIAPMDGSEPTMANGAKLSAEQIKAFERELEKGTNDLVDYTKSEVDQTTKAIDAYFNKLALQTGMTLDKFREGVSSMEEFDRRIAGAKEYNRWQQSNGWVDMQTGRWVEPKSGNPYEEFRGWDVFRVDKQGKNSYNELVNLIRQRDQQISQAYSLQGQAYRTMNRAEGFTVRQLLNGGGGATSSSKPGADIYAQTFGPNWYSGLAKGSNYMTMQQQHSIGIDAAIKNVPVISDWSEIDEEAWQEQLKMIDDAKEKAKALAEEQKAAMKALEEEAKKLQETWDLVAGSISTVGGALAGLEDPAAKVAGTLMQAIATMALSYAEATLKAKDLGPIAWLAFAATGLATFLTASSSIKQATAGSYATGGIVPGNNYNDGLTANVSSGELILNVAQQNSLASLLRENNRLQLSAVVSGEQIRFVLNNNSRRRGKGEYMTTKMNY